MAAFTQTFFTGVIATAAMVAVLYLIRYGPFESGDILRATGSFFNRSGSNSLAAGLAFYFVTGVLWAFLFVWLWSFFRIESFQVYLVFAIVSGYFFGLTLSFLMLMLFSESHPMPAYRERRLSLAFVNLIGFMIFALGVGVLAWYFGLRFAGVPCLADCPVL